MPIILPYNYLLELPLILPILREPDIHHVLIKRDKPDCCTNRRSCLHILITCNTVLRIKREHIPPHASVNAEEAAAAIVNVRRMISSKFQIKGVIVLHIREQFVKRAPLLEIFEHLFAQCSLIHALTPFSPIKTILRLQYKIILLFFQLLKNIFLFLLDIINQSIYNPDMFTDN